MPITAAQVEANGWVLRLTISGSLGSFASYTLDPDGTPRVVLASSHAGFVKSAGTAVAGSIVRNTVATVPLRQPALLATGLTTGKVIDETDLGGGSIRVRLALSETIYATDTALALTVRAGWRSGEAAASGIAVTNSSTITAPVPIFRWVLAPYDVATGAFRVALLVGSHHPVGFEPVAGVKFTATDGSNVKTVWTTSLTTDNSHGDNLRCYSAIIDPATASALTAGLLRCDAEVYPWLGSMRSTDTAGTRSMTGLASASLASSAASPWVIGYDPAGTRYSAWYAYVDPVNGTTTAAATMIAASHAAAKAIVPASRPKDVITAMQAMFLVNRSLPAANGGAAATRACDGLRIRLAAGTHAGAGTGAVTTGATTTEIPVFIEGDPDNSDPRSNCILQTATSGNPRVTRVRLRRLRLDSGTASLMGSQVVLWWLDDMEIRGKAGQETNTIHPLSSGAPPANQWNLAITNVRISRTGWRVGAASTKAGLVRATQHSRQLDALCMVKNRFIPVSEDTTATGDLNGYSMWVVSGGTADVGSAEDIVLAYNDARAVKGIAWSATPALAASAGTLRNSHRRHLILNNIFERIGGYVGSMCSYGEDELVTMSYIVMEGNTVAGDRWNAYYSDPLPTTTTDCDSQYNEAFCIRQANNFHDRQPSKQDEFFDPTTQAVRAAAGITGATGYRPQMIFAWAPHYGCGLEGNYDSARVASLTIGNREYNGLRSIREDAPTIPGWIADRSQMGTNTGLGDYRPVAGSRVLGRISRANSDVDWAGVARQVDGPAGALQPLAIATSPASARSGQRANAAAAGLRLSFAPRDARSLQRAGTATAALGLSVAAAGARHSQRAGAAALGLAIGLAAASARQDQRGASGPMTLLLGLAAAGGQSATIAGATAVGVTESALALAPASGRLGLAAGSSMVRPQGAVGTLRTLLVPADRRTIFVN